MPATRSSTPPRAANSPTPARWATRGSMTSSWPRSHRNRPAKAGAAVASLPAFEVASLPAFGVGREVDEEGVPGDEADADDAARRGRVEDHAQRLRRRRAAAVRRSGAEGVIKACGGRDRDRRV